VASITNTYIYSEKKTQTSQTEPSQRAGRAADLLSTAKNQNLSSLRILWPTPASRKMPTAGRAIKMIIVKI